MAIDNELTWRLSDPGMDLLERAGLAGLYMALLAAQEAGTDLSPLAWTDADLTADSVTVRWTGSAKPAFVKLMNWAWQSPDGVLYLPAVQDAKDVAAIQNRVSMHNGIMRTFLQHTNVQPKGEPVTRIIQLDENKEVMVSFQPPIIRPPKVKDGEASPKACEPKQLLKPSKDLNDLFDSKDRFRTKTVELSNWVYPGIAGRYGSEGAWEGMPERAILLMLAPTVCFYQRLQGEGGNWVFVIPDIRNLGDFAITRRRMSLKPEFTDVASMGDAGLRFLAEYSTQDARKKLQAGCRVVAMGKVGYYASQSIRKSVLDVPPDLASVRRYRLLQNELPNAYVALKVETNEPKSDPPKGKAKKTPKTKPSADNQPKAAGFIKLPAARGRIADNLVTGRAWYSDLIVPQIWDHDEMERQRKRTPGTSIERLWFQSICYQRSKLMKLIAEDAMWDDPRDKCFLDAFWDTLSRLYFLERKAAEQRGGARTPEDRMNDLNEKTRRELMQAKTHILLRKTLCEFFAKAAKLARSESLIENVAVVWKLIDADWRKGRDLALLALMTYQSREKREKNEPNEPSTTQQGA